MTTTTLKAAVAAIAIAAFPAHAGAEETIVTLDQGIAATLALPEGGARGPAVVLLHGFNSSRDEIGGLFATQATVLAERGIASLRIDFRGYGESAGDASETTIDRMIEDVRIARAYLGGIDGVDPARIGAIGYSFGAAIAMLDPADYASLVVWGQMGDLHGEFLTFLGAEAFETAAAEGAATIDMGWSSVTLGNGFFESLQRHDIARAFSGYGGAFLTIAGEDDHAAGYLDRYASLAEGPASAITIPEADHMLGVFSGQPEIGERVIEETANWLAGAL